jgi:sulfur carrier protein ThiS
VRTISVDVWLYGPLARFAGRNDRSSFANQMVELPEGSRLKDLLTHLSLPHEQRGITFINGKLTALPGRQPDLDYVLKSADRVALFHLNSMWPFQYRHGAALGEGLAETSREDTGLFHHRSR